MRYKFTKIRYTKYITTLLYTALPTAAAAKKLSCFLAVDS